MSYRVQALDDLAEICADGLVMRPVRDALGVRAFGTNAFSARAVGDELIEPHDEDDSGHDELYFVARGRATFTLGEDEVDAPAGTFVAVDPPLHRRAVAAEPGTAVLAFGGPPVFRPSAWEVATLAYAAWSRDGDDARARELIAEGLAASPPDPSALHYQLACLEAVRGRREAALEALRQAVVARPSRAAEARDEEDLAPLAGDPAFAAILGEAG